MREERTWRNAIGAVEPRVLIGFAVAIATLLVISVVTLVALAKRTEYSESVGHTFSVLRSTEELLADVSDSQLALAEFVATGDPDFLAPYETARTTIPKRVEDLRALITKRPEARAHLDRIEPLLKAALESDARQVEAQRAGVKIEQLRPLLLESKVLLDQATSELDALKDATVHRLDIQQQSLARSIESSTAIVVFGDVVLLVLVLMAATIALRDAADKKTAIQFQRRVLSMVGHDLRSPLTAIMMSAAQLAKTSAHGDKRPSPVSRILAATNRMESMIRDLLDYSRIELRIALPLEIRASNVDECCTKIVEEFRAVHPGHEIRYEPGDRPQVHWDPDRIEQVLANLVGNALKYGDENTPVRVSWHREPEVIVIEVNNRGAPIPSDVLPHIFEPFRRGNRTDHRTSKNSLGLGLYIVRHIIAEHGGDIAVRSSYEHGTTFRVTLPAIAETYARVGA